MLKKIIYLKELEGEHADVIAHLTQLADHGNQSRRYFAVGFREAKVRIVYPASSDPLDFDQQVVSDIDGIRSFET